MPIVTGIGTINGTSDADIIVDNQGGNSTINGLGGNDLIYADHDLVFTDTDSGNASRFSALNINQSSRWSTLENQDVGDTSIPYTTVIGRGANAEDWFAVTVGAGARITLDIDYGNTDFPNDLGGGDFDTYLRLYNSAGAEVASDDDSNISDGGLGSSSVRDSYLDYTATATATYFIKVSQYFESPISFGDTYVMQVSVEGHANTNAASFGNDSVDAGTGDDRVYGFSGNDTLLGNLGADTLLGGSGDDLLLGDLEGRVDFDTAGHQLFGGLGDDTLEGGSSGADALFGEGGDDVLRFGSGADTAAGGFGNDRLVFTAGSIGGRTLDGGGGRDILDLNEMTFAETVRIALTRGILRSDRQTDSLAGIEDVYGSQGADIVNADTGANELRGNGGDDMLRGFAGDDTLLGGSDNDTVLGGYGDDLLAGNDGDDSINGQVGEDTIFGGAGNDTLRASFFNDTVNGGDGDDFIDGGALDDVLSGQADDDTINGVTGNDLMDGGSGNDVLRGGAGIDTLLGGSDGDTLAGGDNSDALFGEGGNDNLQGQGGLDTLEGGNGNDTLIGGDNADSFLFYRGDDRDTIRDFADNQDVLALDPALWGGGLSRQQVIDTYASDNGTDTVLDFGSDEITLLGISDARVLVNDIVFL